MKKKEAILGVTGSIAIYKTLDLINQLKERGCNITVIMTKEAQELITALTFQTISGNTVYTDMFTPFRDKSLTGFTPVKGFDLAHIALADKAELILICPATANIIGKLAAGICDDLLTCTVVSSKAPVIICPAMNDNMYKNKIVQENIAKLNSLGYKFVGPVKGRLACGRTGIGHLAPLEEIVQAVIHELK